MLKSIPRVITIGLIVAFSLPIAIQQFAYLLLQDKDRQSTDSQDLERRKIFRARIEDATRLFTWLERVDYDLHLRRSNPGPKSDKVAIVEIGERSLKELGQFPFTRSIYRSLIERLEHAGAKVVAFDAVFPERDSRKDLIDELSRIRHDVEQKEGFDSEAVRQLDARIFELDADEDFATAIGKSKIPLILGFTLTDRLSGGMTIDPKEKDFLFNYEISRRNFLDTGALNAYAGLPVVSIEKIMTSLNRKSSIGHINPKIDNDSVIRSIPAVIEYDGHVLGSLGLRAIAAFYGQDPILDGTAGIFIRGSVNDGAVSRTSMQFPLEADGSFRLRYYGKERVFPYIEFSDIVKEHLSKEELRRLVGGKIIFLGATAMGLKDLRATPFSADYPGVETHATMASNAIEGHFLLRDHRTFFFGYLLLWFFGAFTSWVVYRYNPLAALTAALVSVFCIHWLVHFFGYNNGLVIPSLLPSLACLSLSFAGIFYRYFTEQREKKAVRAAFSRYVSNAVVDEILKEGQKLELGGKKKELTVMFVDLVGFTRVAEHRDASFITQLLNEYFTRMTRIILRNQGTLDKYMGDAILCFWGAPLDLQDHANLACRAALEIREELKQLNHEWKMRHGITIENRIGINSAEVAVGNMGSEQVFSYTVMGDGVNLASRIERVNSLYGTHIVVTQNTAVGSKGGFLFRPLDCVQVKGKDESVEILELVSFQQVQEPEWIHTFRTALSHYRAGEWNDAESSFRACLCLKPGDGPSGVFLERIKDLRLAPPEEWKGVWKIHSK